MPIDFVLDVDSLQTEIRDSQDSHEVVVIGNILRVEIDQSIQGGVPEEIQGIRLFEEALHEALK